MGKAHATANLAPAFVTATAAATGVAERSVQRGVARYAALGPELLKRLVRTPLDVGVELDALANLSQQVRDDLAERAARGEQVSAAGAVKAAAAKAAPAGKKSEPPIPARPAGEKPAAPKQAGPAQDETPGPAPRASPSGPAGDYAEESRDALAALQQTWLRAPVHSRELFLGWLASGWVVARRPPLIAA